MLKNWWFSFYSSQKVPFFFPLKNIKYNLIHKNDDDGKCVYMCELCFVFLFLCLWNVSFYFIVFIWILIIRAKIWFVWKLCVFVCMCWERGESVKCMCEWYKNSPFIFFFIQAVPFINFGLLFGEHPLVTTVSSRSKNKVKSKK